MRLSRRSLMFAALASAGGMSLPPGVAWAERGRGRGRDDDHDRARAAVAQGDAISLAQILPIALRIAPGEVLEVELEREHGQLVYEIEILGRDGRVRKLEIDARTGRVLELDDD